MKTIANSSEVSANQRGFSLIELMIVIGALSSVTAMAFVAMSGTSSAVKETKLRQDVAAVNAAVRTYLANGGNLPTTLNADGVITKLKSTAAASMKSKIAGMRGTMVDLRLKGIASTALGESRAFWDSTNHRFEITTTGVGYASFALDPAAIPTTLNEEPRKVMLSLDNSDKWIWGFGNQDPGRAAPRTPPVTSVSPISSAPAAGNLTVLQAPEFSLPGALYPYSDFNPTLQVSLVDKNTPNTSDIFYSTSNGPWARWTGTPLAIPRALATEVRAYSAPLDADLYEESAINSATYGTIFFTGIGTGVFTNPTGDSRLVTNLAVGASNAFFSWGSPAVPLGFTQPNSLTFAGRSFNNIAPDQVFELGTLAYFNGTTYSGTNATNVKLKVGLNLTTPDVVENLAFSFNLLSTPNKNKNADDDADYVYIPDVSTKFNTTIKGKVFYLVLSFGSSSANGFTTIDEFHTHENKTMTGSIFGRFTTNPPAS